MSDSRIRWPEEHRPEVSAFLAVNELEIDAEPEAVWAWLVRPDLWSRYYPNARLVRHIRAPGRRSSRAAAGAGSPSAR